MTRRYGGGTYPGAVPAPDVSAPVATLTEPGRPRAGIAFRPDVEGLRAIAILAVVGYHAGLPFLPGGFVGVDVFFVISGFLITGLLVAEISSTGRISLARFWARRARRLLPAATLVLGVVALASFVMIPALDHASVGLDIVASALYVANMRYAVQATDYLASDSAPSPVLHFWSLGVEEQFYVVWPLLILGLLALEVRRRTATGRTLPRSHLAVALSGLGVVSFLLSLRLTDRVQPWAFFGMPTRAWEFAIGGLLAIGATQLVRLPAAARAALGWAGAAVLLGSVVLLDEDVPYPGTAALWPVLGTAAVIAAGAAARPHPGGVPGLLSTWPMRAVGRLSYSWYLWHWPFLVLAASVLGPLGTPTKVLLVLLALLPSALAYRFVERPLHHLPSLVASTRRSLLVGGALSAAAALAGLALVVAPGGGSAAAAITASAGADEQTGRGVASAPTTKPSPSSSAPSSKPTPSAAPVVWPTGALTPSPGRARGDLPAIYGNGCHLQGSAVSIPGDCAFGDTSASTTVVMLGDSHAAQWFPALDALGKQHGFRLLARTKAGCPAPDVSIFSRSLKRLNDECDTWRQQELAEIARIKPALVVAAGTRTDSLVDRSTGSKIDGAKAPGEWQAGWTRTLRALSKAGVPVAVVRDTPWPGSDVAVCVSKHTSNPSACDVGRDALDDPRYDVGAVKGITGAHAVDLSDVVCDADRCPATRGKYLVYRDSNHLTATFATALAPYLYRQLAPYLR